MERSRPISGLPWRILAALALAIPVGLAAAPGGTVHAVVDFAGTLFLNALKMLIVPLVVSSIISGIAGIGSSGALGRLGGKTLAYYLTTSLVAILTGLLLVNLLTPGLADGEPVRELVGLDADTAAVEEQVAEKGTGDLWGLFLRLIPTNVFAAAADGQMLGLIFFSILFGYFMTRTGDGYADTLYNFWQGVFRTMMYITEWVMWFAPLGVFALVARVVAETGFAAFLPLMWFFLTVLAALAAHLLLILPLLLRLAGFRHPYRQHRALAPALLTAFSTSSSSATLPLTMECVERNVGVSNRTSSFVLPLGATLNMDGTALYECVAAMFIAQAYGLDLGFAEQFTVVLVALVTSIGVAGVPAASLVAIAIILGAIGLPAEGIGLILAVDRILDMCRTAVNIFGDSCGATIVARLQGEKGLLET